MREKSSRVFTSFCSLRPLRCATKICSVISGGNSFPTDKYFSNGPNIKVSGVRNSWLTFEKNVVLVRVQFRKRFASPLLFLVGARCGNRRSYLLGH